MTGHIWTLSVEMCLFIIWLVAYKCLWKKSHRIIFNVQSIHRAQTPFVMIGNVSYSAYLIHYPLNRKLFNVTNNRWIIFAITLIFSVILAWIIDTFINKT